MPPAATNTRKTLPGFIVVEGLDGTGTTTQTRLLEQGLRAHGHQVQISVEPTPGPIGTLIKQIMRGRLTFSADRESTERQLAYLFAADRHDHLYNEVDGIAGQLQRGNIAISTRYFFSSYAYNARTMEGVELVDRLNRDFPLPELVVYLTCPLETILNRLGDRDIREFYEREEELRRVERNFEAVLGPIEDRVIRADSTLQPEETAASILARVLARLPR